MKTIAIYGANGHGKVVADIALSNGYNEIIFIDDGDNSYLNFKEYIKLYKYPVALGIGKNSIRKMVYEKIKAQNLEVKTLVHLKSIVAQDVILKEGVVIMPGVVVNTGSTIGVGSILNTSSVIEHDCVIGDFVHIAPNSALAGDVCVKDMTFVGISSSVIQGKVIGENSVIGAGSVVIKDIPDNALSYGVPAKVIK